MLQRTFNDSHCNGDYWGKQDKLLLAVSGGVDSRVLLELFLSLPSEERPLIGVIHVNHQLRTESDQEAQYLKDYCKTKGLPYYEKQWQRATETLGNVESQAREFRYNFFSEIYQREGYQGLVTGHHSDDQAETILMKLTSGSQLRNLVGIRKSSRRSGMMIYRPLLAYSKNEIQAYATERKLRYFEDETNRSDDYFRNRVRTHIIPQLKAENPNFLKQIHSFVKQIEYANDIVAEKVADIYQQLVTESPDSQWTIDNQKFQTLAESQQYMFLVHFFQENLISHGYEVNEVQLAGVMELANSQKASGQISLPSQWLIIKSYQQLTLVQGAQTEDCHQRRRLKIGESLKLSPREHLLLQLSDAPLSLPAGTENWSKTEMALPQGEPYQELMIRKAQPGDRFSYNQGGNTKKVSRYFIDEKIPHQKRQETWLVVNTEGQILWILPFRKSYLSIEKETDKIHYRLIYLKNEQDLEGDSYVGEGH